MPKMDDDGAPMQLNRGSSETFFWLRLWPPDLRAVFIFTNTFQLPHFSM
jgi:hypothetical protein